MGGYTSFHCCWLLLCLPMDLSIAASSKHQRSEVKAVLLSDIHTGSYVDRKQLHKIVDAVNRLQPDLVIMAGDTFDQDAFGHCDMDGVKAELQRLQPEGNVYAVLIRIRAIKRSRNISRRLEYIC